MVAPQNARRTISGGRYYLWENHERAVNERFMSVTTIIDGGIPKPALMGWGIKMTAIGAIKHHDKIAALISDEGLDDPENWGDDGKPTTPGARAAYKFLWDYRFAESERAAKLGTRVHEAIEAYALDKPLPPAPDNVKPYIAQAVRFLTDYEVLVEMTEASVFNRSQRYAGTLDMIATIAGQSWLIDAKSGKGIYAESALQMSAYAHAEFIGRPDGHEEPMPKVERAGILHLRPDSYELIPVRFDDEVFAAFCYAREVFRWSEQVSKGVIGDPLAGLDELAANEAAS